MDGQVLCWRICLKPPGQLETYCWNLWQPAFTNALSHNFNRLTYGTDNWIYVANGGNGGNPYWWGDTIPVMNLRGQDFRFSLDKKIMERMDIRLAGLV